MPDSLRALATEYVYVSDRLVGEIVDQIEAAKSRSQLGSVQIRPPFLAVESRTRDLGANRYALTSRATEAINDLTGTFAYPSDFVVGRALVSWWDLRVADQPAVRVARIVARQDGDDGRYLLAMCGSVEHYIGYDSEKSEPAGWRPSALPGLAEVLKAFNYSRGRKFRVDSAPVTSEAAIKDMVLEAANVGMMLDAEKHGPIGVGRVEVLARIYYGLRGRLGLTNFKTGEVEDFDGVYLGTPIWVRTPAQSGHADEVAAPGYGGATIIDVG